MAERELRPCRDPQGQRSLLPHRTDMHTHRILLRIARFHREIDCRGLYRAVSVQVDGDVVLPVHTGGAKSLQRKARGRNAHAAAVYGFGRDVHFAADLLIPYLPAERVVAVDRQKHPAVVLRIHLRFQSGGHGVVGGGLKGVHVLCLAGQPEELP